jgi:hypothetical protein
MWKLRDPSQHSIQIPRMLSDSHPEYGTAWMGVVFISKIVFLLP